MRLRLSLLFALAACGSSTGQGSGQGPTSTVTNGRIVAQSFDISSLQNGLPQTPTQIWSFGPDGSDARQLTTAGSNLAPSASSVGLHIYFTSDRTGAGEIWVMDADGGNQKQVTSNSLVRKILPAESPDGTKLAFAGADPSVGHFEIYVANVDGTDARRLTFTPIDPRGQDWTWGSKPSWSPDGTTIAFASTQSGSTEIWTMNADGTGAAQLTFSSQVADYPDSNVPAWSPDGQRIVYFCGHEKQGGDVWIMNRDGTGKRKLTETGANGGVPGGSNDNPAWSPDGTEVAFDSGRDGHIGIWVVSASGGAPRLLAHGFGMAPLAWLPGGS